MPSAPPKPASRPIVPATPATTGSENEAQPVVTNEAAPPPKAIKVEKVRQLSEIKAGNEAISFMESFKTTAPSAEISSTGPVAAVDVAGGQAMANMPVSGETFDALGTALIPPPLEMYGNAVAQLKNEVPAIDDATAQLNVAIEVARKYETSAKLTTAMKASNITPDQLTEETKVVLSEVTDQWKSEGKTVPKVGENTDFDHAVQALAYARELAKRRVGEDGKVLPLEPDITQDSAAAPGSTGKDIPSTADTRDSSNPVIEEEIAGKSVKEQLSVAKTEVKKWFGIDAKKAEKALEKTRDAALKAQVARIKDPEDLQRQIDLYKGLGDEAKPEDLVILSALVQEQKYREGLTGTPEQIKAMMDERKTTADATLNAAIDAISGGSRKLATFLQLLRNPEYRSRMEEMYALAKSEIQENRGDAANILFEIVKLLLWDMGGVAVTEITGVGKR